MAEDGLIKNIISNSLAVSNNLTVTNDIVKIDNNLNVGKDLVVSNTISAKNVNEDIRNKAYTLNNKIDTHSNSWVDLNSDIRLSGININEIALSPSGDFMAIGEPNGIQVYKYISNGWVTFSSFINNNNTEYGMKKKISFNADGTIIAIGLPNWTNAALTNHEYNGKVIVYEYNNNTDSWIQKGSDINGLIDQGYLGSSISLNGNGNILAIGSPYYTNSNSSAEKDTRAGKADIYEFDTTTQDWISIKTFIGKNSDFYHSANNIGDNLGTSLFLNKKGNIISILSSSSPIFRGTYGADDFVGKGDIKVYKRDISNNWEQLGDTIILNRNLRLEDSIAMNYEGNIIASIYGQVIRVYHYVMNNWVQLGQDIIKEFNYDDQVFSLSLNADGTILAIGDNGGEINNIGDNNFGKIRVYQYSCNKWEKLGNNIYGEKQYEYSGYKVLLNSKGNIILTLNQPDINTDYYTKTYHLSEYFKSNVRIDNNLNVAGDVDIQGKIKGDVVIGEDSTDLMVVNSRLNIQNLPTSSNGLSAGDIYVDNGNLKVFS